MNHATLAPLHAFLVWLWFLHGEMFWSKIDFFWIGAEDRRLDESKKAPLSFIQSPVSTLSQQTPFKKNYAYPSLFQLFLVQDSSWQNTVGQKWWRCSHKGIWCVLQWGTNSFMISVSIQSNTVQRFENFLEWLLTCNNLAFDRKTVQYMEKKI